MDDRTLTYYDEHACDIADQYDSIDSPIKKYFALAFPQGARIVDIGTGSGRDLCALVSDGYTDSYGIDPSRPLLDRARSTHPQLGDRLLHGKLPDLPQIPRKPDGILCSAVLQHIPRSQLFESIYAMKDLLPHRGRVLTAIPTGDLHLDHEGRDPAGRLFNQVTPEELELLFSRIGFVSIGRWDDEDALGRTDRRWATLLFELRSVGEYRPLDLIAAVLSHKERKVATYKFALIRALTDIALTQPKIATWTPTGQVRVPMDAVAERWIGYYWPIFTSKVFLPQMHNEWTAQAHKLGFRNELFALIALFHRQGGLTTFSIDRRCSTFTTDQARTHRKLMTRLRQVIKQGPVTYAGGSLPSRLFEEHQGHILVDSALWQELTLMGTWINDAIILRWADLVSDLSKREIPPQTVVTALMQTTDVDRETQVARSILQSRSPLTCVWTGATLRSSFHVDHVIPYSLWHNNDLWNLMPTTGKVNEKKRAKLPTCRILRARRDPILHYWDIYRSAYPERFNAEAAAQTGEKDPALQVIFQALMESVEVSALRWGCERWEPGC